MCSRHRADTRAVSDVLGYVLVFSLIVVSVGSVTVFGFQGLQDARDFERVNNAERAFDILADNMGDVARHGAPSRATEIKLADAELRFGDPVTVNVSAVNTATPSEGFTREYETRPIVYDANTGAEIAYESGAIVRSQSEGSVMVRRPDFVLSQNLVVIPLVVTRADADSNATSIAGSTTTLIRADHAVTRVAASQTVGTYDTVYLNVTSTHPEAWSRQLNDYEDVSCTVGGPPNEQTVYCTLSSVERVYVSTVEIDVAFE